MACTKVTEMKVISGGKQSQESNLETKKKLEFVKILLYVEEVILFFCKLKARRGELL